MEGSKLFKARASRLGDVMTEAKAKSDLIGETARTYLLSQYIFNRWGRFKEFSNKFVEKGLAVEEDAITLYSRYAKKYFTKNEDSFENDFITGHPDVFIMDASRVSEVVDVKSSWDLHTFYKAKKTIDKKYYWQLQAYMELTGASKARLVYCLIDTPQKLIDQAVRYAVNDGAIMSEELIEATRKNMTFADIPIRNRVVEFTFNYNGDHMRQAEAKILLMREEFTRLWEEDFQRSV